MFKIEFLNSRLYGIIKNRIMNIKKNGLMAAAPNMGDEPQNAEEVVNCTSDEGCVGKEFTCFFENEELEEEVTKQDLESEQVGQMLYYPSSQDEDEETSKEDSSMTLSCTVILWRSGRMELSTQDAEDDKVLRKVFNRLIKGRYYAYDYAEKSVTFEPYALPQKGKEKVKAFMFGGEWTKTSVNYEFRYFVPRQRVFPQLSIPRGAEAPDGAVALRSGAGRKRKAGGRQSLWIHLNQHRRGTTCAPPS